MTGEIVFIFVGEVLILCAGIVVMSIASWVVEQLLDVEVSGSHSAKICHKMLGMANGGFLIWLMSVTVFGE